MLLSLSLLTAVFAVIGVGRVVCSGFLRTIEDCPRLFTVVFV
jgi:hypothetical protein